MPFIDDTNYDAEWGGAFQSFDGGKIGDLTIAAVNTKSIDDSSVQALENQAAQLSALQSQREAEAAAAAAAAAKLAEEKKRADAKASILADIDKELGALASLLTRVNAIINIANPYKNSQFSDVAQSATAIVASATAIKNSIEALQGQLSTAKTTANQAKTSL